MESEEFRSILAIVSLGLGIFGFFYLALFVGPVAMFCGILALYPRGEDKPLETSFKICAIIGLFLGVAEVVFAILGLAGLLPPL